MPQKILFLFCCIFLILVGQAHSGLKESLEERGIETEAVYTVEFWSNTKGGIEEKETYLSNFDLTMTVDTHHFGLPEGGTFFVYFLDNSGSDKFTGDIVGDLQTVSNIEASRTTRIYELWYEQLLFDDSLSLLIGLHDYNSEFAVTEYGGLFINGSFGISPEISGRGRPSVFNLTALGSRLKVTPNDNWDFLFGVYDGDPGDPDEEEHFSRADFDREDGAFIALESTFHFGDPEGDLLPGFIKVGGWYNTGKFDDVVDVDSMGNPLQEYGNYGGYVIIDKMIHQEDDEQGTGLFVQLGAAPESLNEVGHYVGAGVHSTGLIPGRDEDELGLAIAYASISDDLTATQDEREVSVELTYRAQINDRLALQPDIQYIKNPGAVDGRENALVAGLRVEYSFF